MADKNPLSKPEVPEPWKTPFGPWYQAPKSHGSEWWYVSPFTAPGGVMPWIIQNAKPVEPELPLGFVKIFGAMPDSNDFHGEPNPSQAYRIALGLWQQDLKHFKQAGVPMAEGPEGFSDEEFSTATNVFKAWDMGAPHFYEGRYGWAVRFPDSQLKDFESSPTVVVNYSHLVVPQYQISLFQRDLWKDDMKRHPFTPSHIFGSIEETTKPAVVEKSEVVSTPRVFKKKSIKSKLV